MANNVQWIKLKVGMFDGNSFKKIKRAKIGGVSYRDKLTAVWFELMDLAGKSNQNGFLIDNNEIPYKSFDDIAIMLDREDKEIELCMNFFINEKMVEIIDDVYCLSNFAKYQNLEGLEKIREQKRVAQAKWRERKALGLVKKDKNVDKKVSTQVSTSNLPSIIDKEIELDIDKDIDKDNNNSHFHSQENCNCDEEIGVPEKYKEIVDYWNDKKIIVHKKITVDIINAIKKRISLGSEQIKLAIDRYKTILDDEDYFFSYKWSLKDFLNRKDGITSFLDEGTKWINYQSFKENNKNKKQYGYNKQVKDTSKVNDYGVISL